MVKDKSGFCTCKSYLGVRVVVQHEKKKTRKERKIDEKLLKGISKVSAKLNSVTCDRRDRATERDRIASH